MQEKCGVPLACLVLWSIRGSTGERVVPARTGPVFEGAVTSEAFTVVGTTAKRIWLRNLEVARTTEAGACLALPVFRFNQELLTRPKKGRLGPVLEDSVTAGNQGIGSRAQNTRLS